MRITAIIAFVAVVHIGSASIAAQQPTDGLPPKANPFGNLFAPSSKPPSPPRFLFRLRRSISLPQNRRSSAGRR